MGRVYSSDLPHDGRWPHFMLPVQVDAVLAMVAGAEFEADIVFDALAKPEQGRTKSAKRLFWEQPEDAVMIRLTRGERHALLAMAHGVAAAELRESEEIKGVKKHLLKRAKNIRQGIRNGENEPTEAHEVEDGTP